MNFNFTKFTFVLLILLTILVVAAVKIKNQPNCTLTSAALNTPKIEGSTANLSWINSQNTEGSYINISTSKSLGSDGLFSEPANIANDAVTNKTSYIRKNLKPEIYYWNVIGSGCGQVKVSKLGSFAIKEHTEVECIMESPILNTPVIKERSVTFSWTNDKNAEAAYIHASTSNEVDSNGFLKKVDIANDVVTNKTSFTKEKLSPGTYYWNVINDGCGQRKISNLGSFTIQ